MVGQGIGNVEDMHVEMQEVVEGIYPSLEWIITKGVDGTKEQSWKFTGTVAGEVVHIKVVGEEMMSYARQVSKEGEEYSPVKAEVPTLGARLCPGRSVWCLEV